jgi:undecaprenyl-diphosphatase
MGSSLLRLTTASSLGPAATRLWHTIRAPNPEALLDDGLSWGSPRVEIDRAGLDRAAVLGAAALIVEVLSSTEPGTGVDRRLFRSINRGGGVAVDRLFAAVTELGAIAASAGAAGVLAVGGKRRAGAGGLAAAGVMWIVGQGMKRGYLRIRPYDALPDVVRLLIGRPTGTSWPSAHPATLLAFLTVAGKELGLSRAERRALLALAALVGLSRVYLGVHYPSDVVAGLLLGRAVGLAWLAARGPTVQ